MKTEIKHTPRPWVIDDGAMTVEDMAQNLIVDAGTPREWVAVGKKDSEGFAECVAYAHPSNATLIAAAPDLLLAVQDALRLLDERIPVPAQGSDAEVAFLGVRYQLRQAIAKAEGRLT